VSDSSFIAFWLEGISNLLGQKQKTNRRMPLADNAFWEHFQASKDEFKKITT
jgi:hypothetical protein